MSQKVYINRTLNLRKIKYVGFDMDHTLVRYNSHHFEELAHKTMIVKLRKERNYPKGIEKLDFDFSKAIRGLVIDKKNGNLLKLNRWGAIRVSYHGTKKMDFEAQKKFYQSTYIDLGDSHYSAIDTAFSIAYAVLFSQLVDLKDEHPSEFPAYEMIADDLDFVLDSAHRDGTLKGAVAQNLSRYINQDPEAVKLLERYRKHDKKLFVLTNSDFYYTKLLLDYAINPYLSEYNSWTELFDFVFTNAKKPRFFYDQLDFLKVDLSSGSLSNHFGPITPGVYQGGCALDLTKSLDVGGDDILYIGDHIYSDILRIKKDCNWRTALIVEELDDEIEGLIKAKPIDDEIKELMEQKEPIEEALVDLISTSKESDRQADPKKVADLQEQIARIDGKISPLILKHEEVFNKYWGEVMRTGNEESYFARQMQSFACIYMGNIQTFLKCSPRTYFRGYRREMPHEKI